MGKRCVVPGCGHYTRKHPMVSYHRFPRDARRLQTWLTLLRLSGYVPNENSYVCSAHFDNKHIRKNKNWKISPRAVPCIFPWQNKDGTEKPGPGSIADLERNATDHGYSSNAEPLVQKLAEAQKTIEILQKELEKYKMREKKAKEALEMAYNDPCEETHEMEDLPKDDANYLCYSVPVYNLPFNKLNE